MKFAVVGSLVGPLGTATGQTPLCSGLHPGNPELISGVASCMYNEVGGAGQTFITLNDTSVIRWNHLGLGNPNANLTFQWAGAPGANQAVLNQVLSGNGGVANRAHAINGNIEFQNGDLVIVNPNSTPTISGGIVSRSLIFTTHNLDPAQETALLNGMPVDFLNATRPLRIENGRIEANGGDIVLAGRSVMISGDAGDDASQILAPAGSVRIFAGESFNLNNAGQERLTGIPTGAPDGEVLNSKTIMAGGDVEIRATRSISNSGVIDVPIPAQRIFLRVDNGMGEIFNDGTMEGILDANRPVTNAGVLVPNTGDNPTGLSTGLSRFPSLNRPGEKPSKRQVVVVENAPVTSSGSALRTRSKKTSTNRSRVASNARGGAPLAQGRSFFGLRGGSTAKKRRR